ncbi:DUF998 domain-containing protein [Constantimarinum furrinae]|uniref:DUF998 domain-containing protein n=1 Tax=Constantimarinum furrinae TaxID=2562285 RepID=A0A7G8PXK2_9FLAO|nr:DUF998 domain-containing protein [Constantimarinum furrinae]QNJ99068.1 hypothetical protein ALE3EI_2534 [Constantimarinum furrinae]
MRLYAKIYIIAYALFIITIFLLPLFSFEGYSVAQNSINELGAQKVPGNWIANDTIVILSLAIALLATKQLNLYWKQLAILYFFCFSFLLTGVYQLASPDTYQYIFNYTDDAFHSLFTIIAGFAFCLFCISFIFIIEKKNHKWQTFGAFSLAIIAPLLMWQFPEYRGLHQRILYLGAFGWLFYALTCYQFKSNDGSISMMKFNK